MIAAKHLRYFVGFYDYMCVYEFFLNNIPSN